MAVRQVHQELGIGFVHLLLQLHLELGHIQSIFGIIGVRRILIVIIQVGFLHILALV